MINKREAILDATLNLLAHKGFHGFSIRDVASQAGVATGTLYLYFADREDLIKQLHTHIVGKIAQSVFAPQDVDVPLVQQFHTMCIRFWQFFLQQPDVLLSKSQFDHLPPHILRTRHEDVKVALQVLFTFFEFGREQRQLKALSDDILFSLGFEPYFEIARKHMLGLIVIDEVLLDSIIHAGWDAISLRQ